MSAVDAAVRRLRRNNKRDLFFRLFDRGEVFVRDILPAHAVTVFFLYCANNHDFVSFGDESEIFHDLTAVSGRCHSALLVRSTATVDNGVRLIALIRVMSPVVDIADTDRINVRVDCDNFIAIAQPADYVPETVDLNILVAELDELFFDTFNDAFFIA
jgi:hypothetical protein